MPMVLRLLAFVALAPVSACDILPRGAALESEVLAVANGEIPDFGVIPVTRAVLPAVAAWPRVGPRDHPWLAYADQPASSVIAVGDTLSIAVYDTSVEGLLNAPGQRIVELPSATVAPSGRIFLPYVGDVIVAGMGAERARERIQEAFGDVIPTAQVQLNVTAGRNSLVSLVGGVGAPGTYELLDRSYSVLDLLSQGGGVAAGLQNPQISVFRGTEVYATSIDALYDDPRRDAALRGGDRVIVEEDERYFLSLGAAGGEAIHAFTMEDLSALDAMSIIGGLNDSRADPGGVLILREYPLSAIRTDLTGPSHDRMVFTIDLTTADGLFSARRFEIMSGDLVYATESPVTATQTIFGLIGASFGLATQVTN